MIKHLKYILTGPKIGPDMYFTHWLLFFKPLRIWFQKKKINNIGNNSEIRPYCTIIGTNNVIIGKNVIIPPGTTLVTLPSNKEAIINIGDEVLLGPNVAIYCSTHNFENIKVPIKSQGYKVASVNLKAGCWIGINSVILPGVTIGRNSVVGANSLVNKDIPDYCIAVGSPAKVIRNLNTENEK